MKSAVSELLFALIVLAIVAVLISSKSKTATIITSAGKLLSGLISATVSPVTAKGTTS